MPRLITRIPIRSVLRILRRHYQFHKQLSPPCFVLQSYEPLVQFPALQIQALFVRILETQSTLLQNVAHTVHRRYPIGMQHLCRHQASRIQGSILKSPRHVQDGAGGSIDTVMVGICSARHAMELAKPLLLQISVSSAVCRKMLSSNIRMLRH